MTKWVNKELYPSLYCLRDDKTLKDKNLYSFLMKSLKHPLSQSYFVISVMPCFWVLSGFFLETAIGIHVSQDTKKQFCQSQYHDDFFTCCISFVEGWIPGEGAWRGPLESSCWIRNNTTAATHLCKTMPIDQAFNCRCSLRPTLRFLLVMLVICRGTVSAEWVRKAFYAIPTPQSLGTVQALT